VAPKPVRAVRTIEITGAPLRNRHPTRQSVRVILCARPEEIREHDSEPSRLPGGDDADGDVDHGEIGIGRDFHDLLKA
jgi:hypothetical protein